MSIKFHATGARPDQGFVAEVVTLPISSVGVDRDLRHNMSFSVFENNQVWNLPMGRVLDMFATDSAELDQ